MNPIIELLESMRDDNPDLYVSYVDIIEAAIEEIKHLETLNYELHELSQESRESYPEQERDIASTED